MPDLPNRCEAKRSSRVEASGTPVGSREAAGGSAGRGCSTPPRLKRVSNKSSLGSCCGAVDRVV